MFFPPSVARVPARDVIERDGQVTRRHVPLFEGTHVTGHSEGAMTESELAAGGAGAKGYTLEQWSEEILNAKWLP